MNSEFDAIKFRYLLASHGESIDSISKKLGVSQSTIYRKISNDGSFSRKDMVKIAEILGVANTEGIIELFF